MLFLVLRIPQGTGTQLDSQDATRTQLQHGCVAIVPRNREECDRVHLPLRAICRNEHMQNDWKLGPACMAHMVGYQ